MNKELSRKVLSVSIVVGILFGALATASAATVYYTQEWVGSSLSGVGWLLAAPTPGGSGPYEGFFNASGASDYASGAPLAEPTIYQSYMSAGNAFFYTTDSSPGTTFTDLNQADMLVFNLELYGPTDVPVYFAVQVGGTWYVSTADQSTFYSGDYPVFFNSCLTYSGNGGWNTMTINGDNSGVAINATVVSIPPGPITGVGFVQLASSDNTGMDYNAFVIQSICSGGPFTAASISSTPISQTVYAGGGAQFVVAATGTSPLAYTWYGPNGQISDVPGKFAGSATSELTIFNSQNSDAGNYYVEVANGGGDADTSYSSDFTLTVNPVPAGVLYAETFPWIGPVGYNNLSTATVGWISAANGGAWSMWEQGSGGVGAVYSYTGSSATSAFFTTSGSDTGSNGLPFPAINPTSYTYVTLEAEVEPSGVAGDEAYFAVQMAEGSESNWYVASSPITFTGAGGFQGEYLPFSSAYAGWNGLTVNPAGNDATIDGPASAGDTVLSSGNITGVGLVFSQVGAGSFNFEQVEILDTPVPTGPYIGSGGMPLSQEVNSGAGVSFGVGAAGGTLPYTYSWYLNGSSTALSDGALTSAEGGPAVSDGAVVSGATTATLTIMGVTTAEDNDTVAATINDANNLSDNTGNYYDIYLNVSDATIGTIYTEAFPYIGPTSGGNESIQSVGWQEAISGQPYNLYYYGGNTYAGYLGTANTDVYYTSTATDTGMSGTPFPNVVLAGYENLSPPLTLSAQLEPQPAGPDYNLDQVTAYWAVQINGSNWYASSSSVNGLTWSPNGTTLPFPVYSLTFSPAKANWNTLSLGSGSGATIGGEASRDLDSGNGVLTGAGLVIVYGNDGYGSIGGTLEFTDFTITGQGVGNIDYSLMGHTLTLSWVGNPNVQLVSATSLSQPVNWQPVPGTLGAYSATLSTTGTQKFYALSGPVSDE